MTTGMLRKLHQDSKGFTLVELMIVVAIIGILAAIAIPQFAAYRIRGYNSSAQSDVRNLNTSEAAFFSDWQTYAVTETVANLAAATGGAGRVGAVIGAAAGGNIPIITMGDNGGTPRGLQIPVGQGVSVLSSTEATVAPIIPVSFTAVGKHLQGDTYYGVDGDSTAVYQDNSSANPLTGVGVVLPAASTPASTTADDFVLGGPVNGPSGSPWTVR